MHASTQACVLAGMFEHVIATLSKKENLYCMLRFTFFTYPNYHESRSLTNHHLPMVRVMRKSNSYKIRMLMVVTSLRRIWYKRNKTYLLLFFTKLLWDALVVQSFGYVACVAHVNEGNDIILRLQCYYKLNTCCYFEQIIMIRAHWPIIRPTNCSRSPILVVPPLNNA